MQSNSIGAGMGTSGLVGQIMSYQTMTQHMSSQLALVEIIIMHIILPAILTLIISEGMRKLGLIRKGDMLLNVK
jgi:hypothetical protein